MPRSKVGNKSSLVLAAARRTTADPAWRARLVFVFWTKMKMRWKGWPILFRSNGFCPHVDPLPRGEEVAKRQVKVRSLFQTLLRPWTCEIRCLARMARRECLVLRKVRRQTRSKSWSALSRDSLTLLLNNSVSIIVINPEPARPVDWALD